MNSDIFSFERPRSTLKTINTGPVRGRPSAAGTSISFQRRLGPSPTYTHITWPRPSPEQSPAPGCVEIDDIQQDLQVLWVQSTRVDDAPSTFYGLPGGMRDGPEVGSPIGIGVVIIPCTGAVRSPEASPRSLMIWDWDDGRRSPRRASCSRQSRPQRVSAL